MGLAFEAHPSLFAAVETPRALRPIELDLMVKLNSLWRPPDISSLPRWSEAKRIAIDSETHDPLLRRMGIGVRRGGRVVGVSFAIQDGPKHYLPWAHGHPNKRDEMDNLPREHCLGYLREQARAFTGDLVGANLGYDLDYLWDLGIEFPNVHRFRDVQIADPLIYELHDKAVDPKRRGYSLEVLCHRWGLEGKNELLLRAAAEASNSDPKGDLWQYPARYVGAYAEDDCTRPLAILEKQERQIEEPDELGRTLSKVYDLECRLLPVLIRMRRRGVRIDMDRLNVIEDWLTQFEQRHLDQVAHLTGVRIPLGKVNAASQLAPALRAAGIPLGTTATGKDSVTNASLAAVKHPVGTAIVAARKINKVRTSFVASIRDHVITTNGESRIHCTFNQLRTTEETNEDGAEEQAVGPRFGRVSCANPNLQHQPGPNSNEIGFPLGAIWRSIFRPDQGAIWGAFDFKQQEPKWSFHFSALLKLDGAAATCQMLRDNPDMDTYEPLVIGTGQARKKCKILWLARAYGQGDATLCDNLGLPSREKVFVRDLHRKAVYVDTTEGEKLLAMRGAVRFRAAGPEGQAIIDSFDGQLPFLKKAAKIAKARAEQFGYVCTVFERRCHFEQDAGGQYDDTRTAFNRIIQGSGADQTKECVIAIEEAGHPLQLQVHDETDTSIENERVAKEIGDIMRHTVPMLVPTTVDIELGPSWGESIKVKHTKDGPEVPYVWGLS